MALRFSSNALMEDADMSASFQSEAFSLHKKIGFSVHTVFTGSPSGSLFLSVSIDGDNFILLPDSTQAIAEAGDHLWNVSDSKYLWAKMHWVPTSGNGNLDAFFSTKEMN